MPIKCEDAAVDTAPPPMSPEQLALLDRAGQAYRLVRRAASVARSSALTTLLIAACTALWAILSLDVIGILIGGVLGAIGFIEMAGYRRLLRGDVAAPRLLMRNQLAFLALIALYCIVQMASFSAKRLKNEALPPDVRAQLAPMPGISQSIDQSIEVWGTRAYFAFYVLLLLVSIICQGGLAWYYASRKRHVQAFNAIAPPWARQVLCKFSA